MLIIFSSFSEMNNLIFSHCFIQKQIFSQVNNLTISYCFIQKPEQTAEYNVSHNYVVFM